MTPFSSNLFLYVMLAIAKSSKLANMLHKAIHERGKCLIKQITMEIVSVIKLLRMVVLCLKGICISYIWRKIIVCAKSMFPPSYKEMSLTHHGVYPFVRRKEYTPVICNNNLYIRVPRHCISN